MACVDSELIAGPRIRVEGPADVQLLTSGGAWVRLHSRYAPEAEASAALDRALQGQSVPPLVALVGVGLGYLVDELERRRPDVRIVALELIPELLDHWRRRRDWQPTAQSGRLVVSTDPSYRFPVTRWPTAVFVESPLVIAHPVLARHFPDAAARAHRALAQFIFEQRANAEARQRLAALYLGHTIQNIPAILDASDVGALDGIAKGEPAIICGAGPSLDRLLPSLEACRDRAWLIAVDTALRPLLAHNIVPDLVVAIDPTTLNGRHLIDLPTRARPRLVAEGSVDPRALTAFHGRTYVCRIAEADPWPWLDQLDFRPTTLKVWGSVLTAACDLAERMDASPVVFAGMDLAFTNGQPYCRGTAFEEDWREQQVREQRASMEDVWAARLADAIQAEELDISGQPTRTSPQMVAFRNWVAARAAASNVTYINTTGAGILHGDGIRQATLEEVFEGRARLEGIERALAASARRSFATRAARVAESISSVVQAHSPEMTAWKTTIQDFDEFKTRRQLQQVERRLSRRSWMPAAAASASPWIDVVFDAAAFSGKLPLDWRVDESNVVTYAYQVVGKTMTLSFKIENSVVAIDPTAGRMPSNELFLRIPDHYVPARSASNAIWLGGVSAKETGYATVHPGFDRVVLFRASEGPFWIDPGSFCLFGQLTFEVQ